MSLGMSLAAVPLLIALNGFFVGAEYAVVAAKPVHVDQLRTRKRVRSAAALAALMARPADAIATIQVCITMTNLMLGWIGEPAMSAALQRIFGAVIALWPTGLTIVSTILSFIIVTLLTVVFSELLPKALTLRYVVPVATLTAAPILAIQRIARPLVKLMNGMANLVTRPLGLGRVDELEQPPVTADELRLMTSQAAETGAVSLRVRSLLLNTLSIARRRATDIMIPRVRITYLDIQRSMGQNESVVGKKLFSRLPLVDGSMDRVIGVVHTKEFLTAYHDEADSSVLPLLARQAVFVPASVSLETLLEQFQRNHTRLVFLVDEHGGVEGLVTLQDLLDELMSDAPVNPSPRTDPPL